MASQTSNVTILENPYILLTDRKISNITEILPLLEEIMSTSRPLLIISEDIEGEALSTLALNTLRGTFLCVAIKAPSYGDKQRDFMEDISLLTSAKYISKDISSDLKNITISELGEATTIKVYKDKTIIIGGKSKIDEIEIVKDKIHMLLDEEPDNYERVRYEDRLARLSDGVAVIEVGAPTEIEMREKKLRIEDALSATKSASKEGIVMGGGTALLACEEPLNNLIITLDGDEKTGAEIIKCALESPIRQIAKNAGVDDGVVVFKVKENLSKNIGYNALTNEYVDMFKSGIIDPTKVTRSAIENAGSVASSILTTEVIVADIPDKTISKSQ